MIVDGKRSVLDTQAVDVAGVLGQAGVTYDSDDLVTPAPSARLADDTVIVVRHAIPVTLHTGSETRSVNVVGKTVADALVAAGLDPTVGMEVTPTVNASLRSGMDIVATDVFVRVVQEDAPIGFNTVIDSDPNLPVGTQKIVQPGVPGRLLRIYQVTVTGGMEGTRTLKAEQVVQGPVDQVMVIGCKVAAPPVVLKSPKLVSSGQAGTSGTVRVTRYGGAGEDQYVAGGKFLFGRAMKTSELNAIGVMYFAHRTMPFGTRVQFTRGGRTAIGICVDRGPYSSAVFDLGQILANELGCTGSDRVSYKVLN